MRRRPQSNVLRIIGGRWRGRRLHFPAEAALRPTPDRVRETLFNWLQAVIPGARCLDLFAGSGALGLEALSRGAAEAVFVDRSPAVIRSLQSQLEVLDAANATLIAADALDYLRGPGRPFDVVFLDPPYGRDLPGACAALLEAGGWLAPRAWIYLEAERTAGIPTLPAAWEVVRSKQAGQVGYHLALRKGPAADAAVA